MERAGVEATFLYTDTESLLNALTAMLAKGVG